MMQPYLDVYKCILHSLSVVRNSCTWVIVHWRFFMILLLFLSTADELKLADSLQKVPLHSSYLFYLYFFFKTLFMLLIKRGSRTHFTLNLDECFLQGEWWSGTRSKDTNQQLYVKFFRHTMALDLSLVLHFLKTL